MQYSGATSKMIKVHFQGKQFNIKVIQVYGQPLMLKKLKLTNSMKTKRPFRTSTKKRCPFHYRGLECKSRKSRDTWTNKRLALEYKMKQGKG